MAEQAQAADSGPRPIVPFLKLQPEPASDGLQVRDLRFGFYRHHAYRLLQVRRDRRLQADRALRPGQGLRLLGRASVVPRNQDAYITAIVDLPEGVSVRSNIIDVDPEDAQKNPKQMFDMAVEMVTNVVAKDREGHEVVAFASSRAKNRAIFRAESYN